jgi:hypothetical protein
LIQEEEITGGRIKLQNEELHNLYSSPNIIKVKVYLTLCYHNNL